MAEKCPALSWYPIRCQVIDLLEQVTVASDPVAFLDNFFDQVDVSFNNPADNEKGCFDL